MTKEAFENVLKIGENVGEAVGLDRGGHWEVIGKI